MKIVFHKNFEKHFKRLSPGLRAKTVDAIQLFGKNPHEKVLRNHKLKGKLEGKRAFYVVADLRVIFEEKDDYLLVIMLDVGSHNQVY